MNSSTIKIKIGFLYLCSDGGVVINSQDSKWLHFADWLSENNAPNDPVVESSEKTLILI